MNEKSRSNALPVEYEIHWYKIEKVLGQGAFGITYLARDINLDRQVAIKEFMPGQVSYRDKDHSIQPINDDHKYDFENGLRRFISEARTLTKFEHPNLVRVYNVFEMNNTAYMVMNYEVGKSLQQILKSRKSLREDELMKILIPLMSGLEVMHAKGFIHRDIKPGNIFIRTDGSPVLLDFGSARQTRSERGDQAEPLTLTNFVSPGYAPIEQYSGKSDRQGPWTDIYGLGATLYKSITGNMPVAAIDRSETLVHDGKDAYLPISKLSKSEYSERFLAAIDHALAFKIQDRPKDISAWCDDLGITQDDIETLPVPEKILEKYSKSRTEIKEPVINKVRSEDTTQKISENIDSEAETKLITTSKKTAAIAAVFLLVVIILLSGGEERKTSSGEMEQIVEETETQPGISPLVDDDEFFVQEAEVPVEETAGSVEEVPAVTSDEDKINELLMLAAEDLNSLRLTTPKDNNAYDKFQQVLALDFQNEAAQQGIQLISDRYIGLAYGAMKKKELDRADRYLNKAEKITQGSEKIAAARLRLNERTEELKAADSATSDQESKDIDVAESEVINDQIDEGEASESDEGFLSSVKKWYKDNAKKNAGQEKPQTTSDKVVDSLGGSN